MNQEAKNQLALFLSRMTNQVDLIEQVVPLVKRHLTPRIFYKDQAGEGAIRRLAQKVKRIDRLVRVAAADIAGRPPRKDDFPEGPWLFGSGRRIKSQGFRTPSHRSWPSPHRPRTQSRSQLWAHSEKVLRSPTGWNIRRVGRRTFFSR